MRDLSNNNIIHKKGKNCEYLQFKRLLKYENVLKHAYGLKPDNYRTKGKGLTKEDFEKALESYKNLCESIGADYNNLVKPTQSHTNTVKCVEILENSVLGKDNKYADTDGLVTNVKGVVLGTSNADCILLIFFDPVKMVIANVHSGWRGTFQKIAVNAVDKMTKEYGSNPKDIICCICPSIRKCHFEVEKDVKDWCEESFGYTNQTNNFIEYVGNKNGKDKWVIDTVLINKIILQDAGLLPENIVDSGLCSVCNSDLIHSYRVEGKEYGLCTAVASII
ncbi:MAG: laccase domain-containing protein [Clostridia bacterium]|nr:laccase domain-containing protein [Clostridia bacterium]